MATRSNYSTLSRLFLRCSPERKRELRKIFPAPDGDEWRIKSLCSKASMKDIWYPRNNAAGTLAKSICKQCPVKRECFATGLFDSYGIWGGYARSERMKILDGRNPIPEDMIGEWKPSVSSNSIDVKSLWKSTTFSVAPVA